MSNIRIGNQTAFSARSVLEPFDFAIANGFTAFEFFPDSGPQGGGWNESALDSVMRRRIRQRAEENDIELTVHGPISLNLVLNPEDPRLYSTVEFARSIGATLWSTHLDTRQGVEGFIEAAAPALRLTAEAGLKLAIENSVWTGPEDFNALSAGLARRKDLPLVQVGMCFDLGHANLYGKTQNNYWRYLDALSPEVRIIHLHLHENFGESDSHLPLFTGPSRNNATGIAGVLTRARRHGFDNCIILEQWPQPPSLLIRARDGLVNLLGGART